jgi:Uma2 family endonuclease
VGRNAALNQEFVDPQSSVAERAIATIGTSTEQRVLLHNLRWETYEQLLRDHFDSSVPRFTFDHGELEIMSPSTEHESYSRRIDDVVIGVADELNIEVEALGSTTFRRKELKRGFEADACFYFRNLGRVLGKKKLDMRVDPPPDLVFEADVTSPSIRKLPIFAEFGVSEVWRLKGKRFLIYILKEGSYQEADQSMFLPGLTAADLLQLLVQGRTMSTTAWRRLVRAWAHDLYGK